MGRDFLFVQIGGFSGRENIIQNRYAWKRGHKLKRKALKIKKKRTANLKKKILPMIGSVYTKKHGHTRMRGYGRMLEKTGLGGFAGLGKQKFLEKKLKKCLKTYCIFERHGL